MNLIELTWLNYFTELEAINLIFYSELTRLPQVVKLKTVMDQINTLRW